jgi:hypothetical protein
MPSVAHNLPTSLPIPPATVMTGRRALLPPIAEALAS